MKWTHHHFRLRLRGPEVHTLAGYKRPCFIRSSRSGVEAMPRPGGNPSVRYTMEPCREARGRLHAQDARFRVCALEHPRAYAGAVIGCLTVALVDACERWKMRANAGRCVQHAGP